MRNLNLLLSALLLGGLLGFASCSGPEQQSTEPDAGAGMETESNTEGMEGKASGKGGGTPESSASDLSSETTETGEADETSDAGTAESSAPAGPGPAISFQDKNNFHDFGIVTHGDIKTHKFVFTNTGTEPLKIKTAKGSCSCINPIDWTKEAVPSGETGYVLAEFNSNGKYGLNRKEITVITNAKPPKTVLKIKAEVPKD